MENKHTNKILDHEKKCYYPGSCPWTFPHVNLQQTAGTEKNISLNTVIQKKNQPKIFQMKKSRKKKWGNEEKNHKLGKEDYEKIYIYIYMATKETEMIIGDCGINFKRKQNKTLNKFLYEGLL